MDAAEFFDLLTQKTADFTLDRDIAATVFMDLTGPEADQWQVRLEQGRAALTRGKPENPDVTVQTSMDTALGLFEKRINPIMAFMTGKVKISGDPELLGLVKKLLGR